MDHPLKTVEGPTPIRPVGCWRERLGLVGFFGLKSAFFHITATTTMTLRHAYQNINL